MNSFLPFIIIFILLFIIFFFSFVLAKGNKTRHQNLNQIRGDEGENIVNDCLRKLMQDNDCLIPKVLLPLKNGHTTEIDTLFITKKGIFCIETKNWRGEITGSDNDEKWYTRSYGSKNYNDHNNPVKQNINHCAVLNKVLKGKYVNKIKNYVLFPRIDNRTYLHSEYTFEVSEFMTQYKTFEDILSSDEVDYLNKTLSPYKGTEEQLKAHKEYMKKTYGDD